MKLSTLFSNKKNRRRTLVVLGLLLVWYFFSLPSVLFEQPTCMVLEDKDGILLGARIAKDGQWRFPAKDSLPEKFVAAIVEFEDRRFFSHLGVDPRGIGRAIVQNFKHKKIVSGGSTISMQVMRMARGSRRTVVQKFIEMILATRLELRYSKDKILNLYAANAPFGGNVVGIEAAAWRYFGKRPDLLSWAEAAMLAVLPNSPALIHPGRNREALLKKRNRLLTRLQGKGLLDSLTWQLACEEPLPQKPLPIPRLAPHLLDRSFKEYVLSGKVKKSRIQTTLDANLQSRVTAVLKNHHRSLSANGIHNLAAVVIEVETGNIVAYVGNAPNAGKDHGEEVDIIAAPRSTGSILKPFLYAMMLQEGQIIPQSLIPDVPTLLGGYRPINFNEKYDGIVPAHQALSRSLNVPLINLLQNYSVEKFHYNLKKLGFTTLSNPPSHYGLTLILGGAEARLLEITNAYACIARMLGHVYDFDGQYDAHGFRKANYLQKVENQTPKLSDEAPNISAAAAWFTFEAMQKVERPQSEGGWKHFRSRHKIAWKTGTSFGFRDAWAVGVRPKYAVGVWVGNADGEGRPGLVGVLAAAPILFDIFNTLPIDNQWFEKPFDDMRQVQICAKSGYLPLPVCPIDTVWAPANAINLKPCTYHKTIHLDESLKWQVNTSCESPQNIIHQSWFVLPPLEAYYFKNKHPTYLPLPPLRKDCRDNAETESSMQLIYPKYPTRIFVPTNLDGKLSRTVFTVAHRNPESTIHWHIDEKYIGSTQHFHNKELNPSEGEHVLTLVDEFGERLVQRFVIIKK